MAKQHGFTLIEAIISAFLISLMVIGVISLFPRVRTGAVHSEGRMNAAFLGKSLMDAVRGNGFDKAVSSSGSKTFSGLNNGNSASQKIDYSINVQSLSSTKKQVWIVLSWNDPTGKAALTVETIMTKL